MLAVALLIPAVALFLVNHFWVGKRSYVTITGKEISLNPFPVPKWVKWTLFTLTMLISLFVLLVYGTLFYGAFTKTWGYDWSFTWENLQYVFLKGEQIWNSIKYGLLASLGAALLAMVLAYIVQKKQVGLNKFLDFLAILPGAIPGMFLGIGFVLAFNGGWLSLTGTGAIMVLALLFWNLPTCYSAATAGLQQIGASVEDAALNLGANSFRSFKDVIIPLLKAPVSLGLRAVLPAVGYLPQRGDLPLRALHHRGHHLCDGPRAERTVGRGGGVYCGAHHHRVHRAAAGAVAPGSPGHRAGTVNRRRNV